MFQNIDIFRLSSDLARHSAKRQSVIAENIANADTPKYQARDIAPFQETYHAAAFDMSASRVGHMSTDAPSAAPTQVRKTDYMEPNGNTVALETELLHAADVKSSHTRALAIYRSALNVMHRVLG
ncbi:FlgB family protein [Rhodobacteraceae bacterium]|nr:FlgB family protein [Paracoccaceae bacterium]